MIFLIRRLLRSPVVRIINRFDSADIVGELFIGTSGLGGGTARCARRLEPAVNRREHRVVVRTDLPAKLSGGGDLIVAGLELTVELFLEKRVHRRETLLPLRVRTKMIWRSPRKP